MQQGGEDDVRDCNPTYYFSCKQQIDSPPALCCRWPKLLPPPALDPADADFYTGLAWPAQRNHCKSGFE